MRLTPYSLAAARQCLRKYKTIEIDGTKANQKELATTNLLMEIIRSKLEAQPSYKEVLQELYKKAKETKVFFPAINNTATLICKAIAMFSHMKSEGYAITFHPCLQKALPDSFMIESSPFIVLTNYLKGEKMAFNLSSSKLNDDENKAVQDFRFYSYCDNEITHCGHIVIDVTGESKKVSMKKFKITEMIPAREFEIDAMMQTNIISSASDMNFFPRNPNGTCNTCPSYESCKTHQNTKGEK